MKPDHDQRRREVGCQSDPAERRDAGIQVDLLTQHISGKCSGGCGAQWKCVSIRADEPLGGSLLQHINLPLPQTAGSPSLYLLYPALLPAMPLFSQSESDEPLHACSLPSMLQCSVPSTEGGTHGAPSPADVPAVPPGLIAPLSPCLAEEEEEEENEKQKEEHLSEQENNKRLTADQPTLKAVKRKMSRVSRTKSRPADSLTNHAVGKPRLSRKRSVCSPVHQKTRQMEPQGKRQKRKRRGRRTAAGIQHSPAEGRGREQPVPGTGVKPKPNETEWAGRPRRTMVHPPVRYLTEYEEQSHGLSSANHSRERGAKVKKKQMRMRRTPQQEEREMDQVSTGGQTDSSKMESEDGGVQRWRQRCQVCGLSFTSWASLQLHLSVHTAGRTFSCQLCNRRFSRLNSLNVHRHRYHSGYKAGRHGSRIRAGLREAKTASGKVKRKKEEVEQVEKWPRFPELNMSPDRTSDVHTSSSSCWWFDYMAVKKRSSPKRKRGQEERSWREWKRKRCRKEEVEVKQVSVEKIGRGEEVGQPQRPRRRMVGPPIRYLLESEELPHVAITTNKTSQYGDKIKNAVGALDEIESGASQVIDQLEDIERHSGPLTSEQRVSHMVAEGDDEEERKDGIAINEEEEPQRPRRRMVGPPVRYLLQSEEPSHSPTTTNHNPEHKPKQLRGRPKNISSDAEGGTSEMIDSSEAVDKQKGHMTSERETGHMVSREEREEEPQRPRRKTVSPPIRYPPELDELSHGIVTPNQNTEDGIEQSFRKTKKVLSKRAEGGVLKMIDRPKDVARQTAHIVAKEKREEEDGRRMNCKRNEKVEEQPERPRRKMVGPPVRYLIESEEPSQSSVITSQNTENKPKHGVSKPKQVNSESDADDVTSMMTDSPEAVDRQTGHVTSDRETGPTVSNQEGKEEPLRPRRKMVGPPVRYLLQSEELSHDIVTTNNITENDIGQCLGRSKKVRFSDAEGKALEMVDRPKDVTRQTARVIFKDKREEKERRTDAGNEKMEEQPQRLRRKTAGPPIRYLLESEELSHGAVAANHNTENKPKQSLGKPTQVDGESEAGGRASKTIDRSEVVDRETGHIVLKEEPQRPRRKMVGPPIRYLLQSEEQSRGIITASHYTENKIRQSSGRPKKVVSDAGGGASGMIDRPMDTLRQTGHAISKEKRKEEDVILHEGNEKVVEQLKKPKRATIGSPVRYLLESEEPSHGIKAAHHNTGNDIRQSSGRSKKAVSNNDAVCVASEMIDRSDVDRQKGHMALDGETGHMVSKVEGEKEPQRPRRKMVGPPIRYLLESEALPHRGATTNQITENKIRRSPGRPKKAVESDAEGGASEMIDSPEDIDRMTAHMTTERVKGHMVLKEERDKGLQRPRMKMVNPQIRYLLEPEAVSHGAVATNHDEEIHIGKGSGISKKFISDVGGALEMTDSPEKTVFDAEPWTYLAHRDLQSGQVTILSPCSVRLQSIL